MNTPVVSVVVLTFNSSKYVRRCLQSLVRQTLSDFEVLVVDAGSTDETRDIVATFDTRFRWLELPNSDMGTARNHGMRMSQGQFLCFLDSDDFYLPSKLERQINELQMQRHIDVVYCAAWHFRTGYADRVGLKQIAAQPVTLKDYLEGRNHNLNTMCMRRCVWEAGFAFGEGARGRYGEEWRLQLSLAQGGVPMAFHPDPLVVVELRPDSHTLWSRQWRMKREAINEIERVASRLTPLQRATVDVGRVTDELRYKLLIALLLDGCRGEAAKVAKSITDTVRARRARRVITISTLLPTFLLRKVLQWLWIWHQNRSFDWQAATVVLKTDFAAVEATNH